jgi:hypothetical protein
MGPKRAATGKRMGARRTKLPRLLTRGSQQNTASVKESVSNIIPDGAVIYGRTFQLANPEYDRAQTVAQAYQEFRIKYIKFTFRPSADTFPAVAGNSIPTLYYMIDKTNSIPTGANAGTFFSLGCRPVRMDDKQVEIAWKPSVLVSTATAAGVAQASQYQERPWLSTNANAFNPGAAWAPSTVDHLGIVFYVTKINPADTLNYQLDIEVEFEFRKPNWRAEANEEPPVPQMTIGGGVKLLAPPAAGGGAV